MHPLPGGSGASAVGIEAGAGGEPGRALEPLATRGGGGGGGGGAWSEGAVLCNAVLAFEARAPFVRRALHAFVSEYVPLSPGLSFEVPPRPRPV